MDFNPEYFKNIGYDTSSVYREAAEFELCPFLSENENMGALEYIELGLTLK